MSSFLLISYPSLSNADAELIQGFRKKHDKQYKLLGAHFTLIFPVPDFSGEDFIAEIKKRAQGFKRIDFVLRSSRVHKDPFSNEQHLFLVPEEGYDEIVRLHDELYAGQLKSHLRHDLGYIPHITIGQSVNKSQCETWRDEWNKDGFAFPGYIDTLTIALYENNVLTKLEDLKLK